MNNTYNTINFNMQTKPSPVHSHAPTHANHGNRIAIALIVSALVLANLSALSSIFIWLSPTLFLAGTLIAYRNWTHTPPREIAEGSGEAGGQEESSTDLINENTPIPEATCDLYAYLLDGKTRYKTQQEQAQQNFGDLLIRYQNLNAGEQNNAND